jgi:Protein of unknown function (DUF3017)
MVQWEVPPTRRLAFVVVLLVVAASLLVTMKDFRWGGYLLAGALGLAAVIRATLPEKYCLGLLVRSRRLDVMFDAGLALAVLITVHIVPD